MARFRPVLLTAVLAVFLPTFLRSQTVTAFRTGEQTTGTTKQCYYDALGSKYTQTISSFSICLLSIQVGSPAPQAPTAPFTPHPSSVTAFLKGERTTGMTKQCFYDALESEYTKTYSSVTLCPLTIQVNRN